jgi:hypothetical protein
LLAGDLGPAIGAGDRGREREGEAVVATSLTAIIGKEHEVLAAKKAVRKTILGRFKDSTVRERKHRTAPATDRYIRAR